LTEARRTDLTDLSDGCREPCGLLARKLRRVESIEEFRAELNRARLAQASHTRILKNGHIHVVLAGTIDDSAAASAEPSPIADRRCGTKSSRVEELFSRS
jgi:hypothetical protein